jgi:adenylate cyclase
MRELKLFQAFAGIRKTAKVAIAAAVALSAGALLRAADPGPITQIRERTFDIYQKLRPRPFGDSTVRIVDINEASLAALGQWPWPRARLASLIDRLQDLGAAAIVFDMIFAESDRTSPRRLAAEYNNGADSKQIAALMAQLPDYDQVFASAMEQAPVVIGFAAAARANEFRPAGKAGFALVGAKPQEILSRFEGAAINIDVLEKAASGVGGINLSARDSPDAIRRLPMLFTDGNKVYPSLVAEALRVAQQQNTIVVRGSGASGEFDLGQPALLDLRIGSFHVPLTAQGELWLYYDRDRPERYVSVQDILQSAKDAKIRPEIEGHIVFVGTSAVGLSDVRQTSLGELVPGVSIEAQAVEQILDQTFLSRPDWANGAEIIGTIFLGVTITWLLLIFSAEYAALIGGGIITAWCAASWFAFDEFGLLFDPIYPALGALLDYLAVTGVLYVASATEKATLTRFQSPLLLKHILQNPGFLDSPVYQNVAVVFLDLSGFTGLAEVVGPQRTRDWLAEFQALIERDVLAHSGFVVSFMGDGAMIIFGLPKSRPDDASRALLAIGLLRSSVVAWFGALPPVAKETLKIRIGGHFGPAVVSRLGPVHHQHITATGDTVNVTSRFLEVAKQQQCGVVVSEDLWVAAKQTASALESVPVATLEVGIRGRAQPMRIRTWS